MLPLAATLLLYLGAAVAVGHGTLGLLEARAATPWPPSPRGRQLRRVGAAALLLAPALLLLAQLQALDRSLAQAAELVTETGWGARWLQLALAGTLGAVGVLVPFPRWRSVGAPMTALAVAVAMSGMGHAGADEAWPRLARALDTGHALAVGGWLGGLALVWADVAECSDSDILMARWSALSAAALVLAPLTIVTGAGHALLRLAGAPLAAAAASEYGRLLALKGALALAVLVLGYGSHRRVRRGATPVARALRAELLLALAVFAVTALLTRSEPPVAP